MSFSLRLFAPLFFFQSAALCAARPWELTNSVGIKMVLIQPGKMQVAVFHPSCPAPNDSAAAGWTPTEMALCQTLVRRDSSDGFSVTIRRAFYIGRYEITQGEWTKVMGTNPSVFQSPRVTDDASRHPVENVSWDDAQSFIKKLNQLEETDTYRLPTEFEWEYAGRAGGPGQVGWDEIRREAVQGLRGSDSGLKPTTHAVGSKDPNPWGLYDMLGNVWEWVQDFYNEKSFPDSVPPAYGSQHVLKGAGFVSDVKNAIYSTHGAGPGDGWDVGFRIVKDDVDTTRMGSGKEIFASNCSFCHGENARGGGHGGPDLAQSALVRSDENGNQLGAFLKVGRPDKGMPAFSLSPDKVQAIAAFLHKMIDSLPRSRPFGQEVLVGDAAAGMAFFNGEGHCVQCHAVTGDLKGIANKYPPAALQGRLVLPIGDGGYPAGSASEPRNVRVTVTQTDGKTISGLLVYLSDYALTLIDSSGERVTLPRHGAVPKIALNDPLQTHLDRQQVLTDKQMHDLNAYLATLK